MVDNSNINFSDEEMKKKKKKNRIYKKMYVYALLLISFCTPVPPPTAPVSRSFGLRSAYEIAILDTD